MSNAPALVIPIDTSRVHDRSSFHDVFSEALGFPSWYGRNMDAWIDCVSSLDDPSFGNAVVCEPGQIVTLLLSDARGFRDRFPAGFMALVECAAFVNWRRMEGGEPTIIALAFNI